MQKRRGELLRRVWAGALVGAITLLLLHASPAAASKNYQLFRLDTSFHFAYTHGPGGYGGGLMLEPKFMILDQLSVGLQTGVTIYGGGSINSTGSSVSMSVGAVVPLLAKVEFYPLHSPIRPFVGFAIGTYDIAAETVGSAGIDQRAGWVFGLSPEIGIELGAFRLSVSYHALIAAGIVVRQTIGNAQTLDVSQNYLTFNIGWRSWGKRRPPPPPAQPLAPMTPVPGAPPPGAPPPPAAPPPGQ